MLKEEIENILFLDKIPFETNGISSELLNAYDEFILDNETSLDFVSSEVFNIYSKFVSMRREAPEGMKNELFRIIKSYIKEKVAEEKFIDGLFLQRFLIMKSRLQAASYYDIAEIFSKLNDNKLAKEFLKLYEQYETNKPLKLLSLGNFYNLQLN